VATRKKAASDETAPEATEAPETPQTPVTPTAEAPGVDVTPAAPAAAPEEPTWLSPLRQKLDEIAEMVKPRESPHGAPVVVQGASKTKPTAHELVTVQAAPTDRQRPARTPGPRRLTFFKFRK